MKKYNIVFIFFFIHFLAPAQDLRVEVEGSVNFSGSAYSIAEAGENIRTSVENESSVFMSVTSENFWDKKNNKNKKWRIFIHKTDINWDNDLQLEVKRSGNGYRPESNGNPNIRDGNTYLDISNTPTYFFRGKHEIAYIPIGIKMSGVSLTMGAKQFETNIVVTVYDDW